MDQISGHKIEEISYDTVKVGSRTFKRADLEKLLSEMQDRKPIFPDCSDLDGSDASMMQAIQRCRKNPDINRDFMQIRHSITNKHDKKGFYLGSRTGKIQWKVINDNYSQVLVPEKVE